VTKPRPDVGDGVVTIEAAGRHWRMDEIKIIRCSIPDGNRCAHCAAHDGEEFMMNELPTDAQGYPIIPPLPDPLCTCAECRCGWMPLYGTFAK
jgi:hypothetical protein